MFFFFNDPATTEIYTYCHTLSLHDALPIYSTARACPSRSPRPCSRPQTAEQLSSYGRDDGLSDIGRSEEHTSELQSLMRISYAVFCLKKKNNKNHKTILISKKPNT